MVLGMTTDDLHPFFEGAVKFYIEILFGEAAEVFYIGPPLNIATINARLNTIKPPILISRTPRLIDHRKKYRGHEWRNWILYYAVPCLQEVLPEIYLNHLKLLIRAIFLVSKDSILPEDILEAER
ncbi:hypothetical protein FOCC_FOCC002249 [Frankliniella occidentalis]|nr:hypothetical protein FOCC_FOCC002249 [Frankliniella occidentalis]